MYQYRYKNHQRRILENVHVFHLPFHDRHGKPGFYSSSFSPHFCKMGIFRKHIPYLYGFRLLPFTIFQPLAIYLSAGKLASASGEDTEIRLDDVGIQVKVGNTYDKIPWRKIVRIAKLPGMAIIFTDPSHGYLLTDRVVGEDKKPFTTG